MGQLFKEHQIALSASATADFKALLNEVRTFIQRPGRVISCYAR
jgi:hypothetical protein